MKMFIAFALLIATVVALPVETERKTSEAIVAQADATVAADALNDIVTAIEEIDTAGVKTLSSKVGDFEGTAPGAVEGVKNAIAALLA